MNGKYRSWPHYFAAKVYRALLRRRIENLVAWDSSRELKSGCTAIIGMCSWLADILPANLRCLESARWSELKEVIVVADCRKGGLPPGFEEKMKQAFPSLGLRFFFYDEKQFRFSQKVKLPYVFSWLSWCIALSECRTQSVLIHDYDALVFGRGLERRYEEFQKSGVNVQGVLWYWVNGFIPEDRMACTFEAFADVAWIKRFKPVMMFNQIGHLNGRSVDFDTLLDIQANHTPLDKRAIVPMTDEELAHPTQMIHQYTVFKKYPGKPWFSASTTMIPFFYWLSGLKNALNDATARLQESSRDAVDLLGDGCIVNYTTLETEHLEQRVRMMVQICLNLKLPPFRAFIEYGDALYAVCQVTPDKTWKNGFTLEQSRWVESARHAAA